MHLRPPKAARKAIAGPRTVPFRQDLSRRSLVCKRLPRQPLTGAGTRRVAPPSIYRNLRHGGVRALAGSSIACALLATQPAPLAGQATELQLTPDRLTLEAGRRQALYAAAYDRQGNIVTAASIAFASSDTLVATVSKDGTVVAIGAGTAQIEARTGALTARSAVTVTGGAPRVAVASLRVEPRAVWLLPLEPARLSLDARLADGTPAEGARIRWRTIDARVATVDRDGLVVGAVPGQTLVEASVPGGAADTVLVSVDTALFTMLERTSLAPGSTDTLAASVPAQRARRLSAGLTWSSSDTTIVRAGPNGEIRALAPGEAVVTASGYGMTGRTRVFVHRPVHSLTIAPRASAGPVRLAPGTTRRFEVRALASDSSPVAGAAVAWTLPDTSIATFSPSSGVLLAQRPGTTTLAAHLDGFEPTTWTVEVVPAVLQLDRARLGLRPGGRTSLRAILVDDAGAPIPGLEPPLTWTSSSAAAVVVGSGEIEARAPGRATVTVASAGTRSASTEVFVTGDMLVSSSRGGATPQALGIHQVAVGVGELLPLLRDSAANIEAVYSPDRSRIAFSSNRGGSFDVYVMDADGGNVARVTSEPGNESAPAWSADGTRLFFTVDRPAGSQIASAALDGSDLRVLTASPGGNRAPAVSADGRSIAFVSARDGNAEIYRMDPDGSNQRRLTNDPAREQLPRWLPDGSLVYVASRQRGAVILRLGPAGAVPIVESPDPIVALATAPEGDRIAYVAGRMLDRGGSRIAYRLAIQPLAGGPPTLLPLAPGEQVATPSF